MFIFLVLIIYRIGSFIPVPGVDSTVLKNLTGGVFGLMDTFSGGAFKSFSIFALGVMPYITASIIIQLLSSDVVPKLTELNKQGEYGRKKIKKITFYLTIVISFIQGFGMSIGFNRMFAGSGQLVHNPSFLKYLMITLILSAGTAFLVMLGEKITKNGVGNGLSILIFAGIVSSFPSAFMQLLTTQLDKAELFISIVKVVLIILAILAITVGAIFVLEAYRKIPIQYSERRNGKPMHNNVLGENIPSVNDNGYANGGSSFLPIKLNTAGVIPVIFASAIVMLPATLSAFVGADNKVMSWIGLNMVINKPIGMALYAVLIFAFSYFYAFIQMDPKKMAENLQNSGGYVQGIRPGKKTEEYLSNILGRLTFVGGIFLVVISVLPLLATTLSNLPSSVQIGGTGLLIVIGVVLQTVQQIDGQLVTRNYRGFNRKNKKFALK